MFVDENHQQMREFMLMSEGYMTQAVGHDREIIEEEKVNMNESVHPIRTDLIDLMEKLRMFTESSSGDYAFGFEAGLQRAADMIENVLNDNFGEA